MGKEMQKKKGTKRKHTEMGKGEKLKKFTWMAFAFTFKWFPLLLLLCMSSCECARVRV